jgi:hypothetical protein
MLYDIWDVLHHHWKKSWLDNGHIHNQGTQNVFLMKKKLQRTSMDFYNIYFLIIIVDFCMPIAKMISY